LGLTQNPFPQLGDGNYTSGEMRLAKLGGEPIPAEDPERYIRDTLEGFSPEFVALCVKNYKRGKYVKFKVEWKK